VSDYLVINTLILLLIISLLVFLVLDALGIIDYNYLKWYVKTCFKYSLFYLLGYGILFYLLKESRLNIFIMTIGVVLITISSSKFSKEKTYQGFRDLP
jgi:hypothetical protein